MNKRLKSFIILSFLTIAIFTSSIASSIKIVTNEKEQNNLITDILRVQTLAASSINPWGNFSHLNGKLCNMGGADSCKVWFVYDTSPHLLYSFYAHSTPAYTKNGIGPISYCLHDLIRGQTYYYRAVANNGKVIDQGMQVSFTPGKPSFERPYVTDTKKDSVTLNAVVLESGYVECEAWFEYGDSGWDEYNYSTEHKIVSQRGQVFSDTISNLKLNTTYYFRSCISNDAGISYYPVKFFFDIGDLECTGSINSDEVEPDCLLQRYYKVKNIGERFSELDWELTEYPEWGYWTIFPQSGEDLIGGGGFYTLIDVRVHVPNEYNKEFSGEIKIVNTNNPDDYSIIPVNIHTAKSKEKVKPIFENLIQTFMQRLKVFEFFFN